MEGPPLPPSPTAHLTGRRGPDPAAELARMSNTINRLRGERNQIETEKKMLQNRLNQTELRVQEVTLSFQRVNMEVDALRMQIDQYIRLLNAHPAGMPVPMPAPMMLLPSGQMIPGPPHMPGPPPQFGMPGAYPTGPESNPDRAAQAQLYVHPNSAQAGPRLRNAKTEVGAGGLRSKYRPETTTPVAPPNTELPAFLSKDRSKGHFRGFSNSDDELTPSAKKIADRYDMDMKKINQAMGNMGAAPTMAPFGPMRPQPAHNLHRAPTMPEGAMQQAMQQQQMHHQQLAAALQQHQGHRHVSQPGGTNQTSAMTLFNPHPSKREEFSNAFTHVYSLIQGWVSHHADQVKNSDLHLAPTPNSAGEPDLWNMLLQCTYPRPSDAVPHTRALLQDAESRSGLLMRVIVGFLVRNVWTIAMFMGVDANFDSNIAFCQSILSNRESISKPLRAETMARMSNGVKAFVADPNFDEWRVGEINRLSKILRGLMLPLLKDTVVKSQAGKDMSLFIQHSVELSVRMHCSNISFNYNFPDCGSKFSASSMISKNALAGGAMALQLRQARVKLVITPMITMREDVDGVISAHNVHVANVLTMN